MFYILFLVSFIIGISVEINKKFLLYFIILFLVVPTGSSFGLYIYKSGVFFFDGFFLGLLISLLVSFLMHKQNYHTIGIKSLLIFSFLNIFYLIYIIASYGDVKLIFLLKDMRPYIYIIEIYLLYISIKSYPYRFNFDRLALFAAISNIMYLIGSMLGLFVSNDVFYQTNAFRYLDASTYFIALYLIYYFTKKEEPILWNGTVLLAIIALLISNSRFVLASLIIIIILFSFHDYKKLFKYTIMAFCMVGVFVIYSQFFGSSDRVMESLSSSSGMFSQFETRFSPATNKIKIMNEYNTIFGYGLGTTFYIPWFEYRDNISNENIVVDSLYLTMFTKMGILSFFFFLALAAFINTTTKQENRNNLKYILYMALIGVVSAYIYQSAFMGFILAIFIIYANEKNNVKKEII